MRFMQMTPETTAQSLEWLDGTIRYNALRPREGYNLAIATKDPDRVIGWIGFGNSERHSGAEHHGVGYMLLSTEWGKGYATEALSAAIAFMTDTLGGDDVWAWCFAANGASERVMEKAGMRFACEFADEETGEPCREYVYEQRS
ncbi:MAG: GNAT family N-acetyltransferase [Thermomicrobiales bacterium]